MPFCDWFTFFKQLRAADAGWCLGSRGEGGKWVLAGRFLFILFFFDMGGGGYEFQIVDWYRL